jgi:hypothetical protein
MAFDFDSRHKTNRKGCFAYQNSENLNFTAETTDTEVYNTDISGSNANTISGGLQSSTNSDNGALVFSKLLKEIYFPNGKIVFVPSTSTREDGLGKALETVEIYGFNVNSNSYTLIKKIKLNYTYKNRINPLNSADKVLFLDNVKMIGNNDAEIGTYSLSYNSQALPYTTSRSKDFWGHYNGQINTTLIPAQTLSTHIYSSNPSEIINIGGANRNPNETLMKAWVLEQITYPSGGFTIFDFEANRYFDNLTNQQKIVGDLRIKSIVSNDGTNKTITKTYKYGAEESGNGTYRDLSQKTYSTLQYYKHPQVFANGDSEYWYNVRVFSSGFISPINANEGVTVTYPIVTEYDDLGTGSNGKTIYTFKNDAGDNLVSLGSTAKQMQISRHWNRGQLLSKTTFGTDNRKKYEQINTYSVISQGQSPVLGYLIGKAQFRLNSTSPDPNTNCLIDDDDYSPIQTYQWSFGLTKQIRTEEYSYDDTDDTKFVYKKAETDFDNTYFQAKEMRSFNSDGKINIQKLRYVTDFDVYNSSLFNLGSSLYWMQENNQINTPIEQTRLVKFSSESENRFLSGQITDFLISAYGEHNYVYPKEIHLFENPYFPSTVFESNYTTSYLSVGILWKDFRYIKRLQSDTYDSYGNLLNYKIIGGATSAFSYSTTLLDNVFHSFPTSEIQNSDGVTSYTTNFAYDIPLLGVKEITAPNGLKTYFEYDNFSRFKRAKDHNGNILKEHDYNFGLGNNFIKEFVPRIAMSSLSGTYNDFQTSINYFDGLRRPIQTVNLLAGFNAQNDIVTNASVYENLGRIEKSYIPFQNVGSGATAPLPTIVHGDTAPYSNVSEYDNSPLNRPKKSFGIGQAWRTANKFIESKYLIVEANTIRRYDLSTNGASINGTWNISLFKSISVSERGKETIEYKDNQGKLIQKDVQDGNNSYASTHYIYDEFDRLKYVIQPQSFQNATNFTENDTYFNAGVFAYKYDKRGRIIESHVPSGGWVYHVFDILDREVLRQTEKQRQNGLNRWKFMKFDAINRTLQKGELTNSDSRNDLQTLFDGITNAYEDGNTNQSFPSTVSSSPNQLREVFIYDNYDFIAGEWAFNSVNAYHANYSNVKGLLTGIVSWNSRDFTKTYHSVFHYDNKKRVIQTYQTHHLGGNQPWTKAIITNFQYNFNGQVLIENKTNQKDNAPNIEDKTENEYDHVGRLTKVFHSINGNRIEIIRFIYDAVGRMIQKKIRGDANFLVGGAKDYIRRPTIDGVITQNNTLDLARKAIILEPNLEINAITLNSYLAQIDPNAPQGTEINGLQTIDFAYHIRGMLLGINLDNDKNLTLDATQGDIFSYKLDYETAGFYDGNIGKQSWKTSKDNALRFYNFNYDDINRLLSASYTGINGEDFSMPNFAYDKNGNISNLQRNGKTGSGFGLMDNLTYSYNGNRLNSVTDAISGDHETDFVPHGGNAYTYYNDGSLKSDDNKEIENIIYDTYLDKPIEIQLSSSRWLKMTYDGSGKLFKREFSTGEYWDFISSLIHKNGQLYQMATPEGRATYSNNTWQYEFFYTDHLGNTRASFSNDGQNLVVKDISDFDPTGISLKGIGIENTTENRFKYQNKESLALFGLSGVNDFGARYADKTINRWWGGDILSEQMRRYTPYNINFNNPLRFIDTDGMSPDDVILGVSNFKVLSKNLYESKDVTLKITLTVVNSTNSDLSTTMFNKKSGSINITNVFGGNLSTKLGGKDVDINVKSVTIDYKVVDKIENAGKGDNIMVIANNIPDKSTAVSDTKGLASLSGSSSAVEANTINDKTFDKVALHELSHNLGLDDTYGAKGDGSKGLMGYANNGSISLTDAQKSKILVGKGAGVFGNGTYSQQKDNPTNTQKDATNFIKDNNIK